MTWEWDVKKGERVPGLDKSRGPLSVQERVQGHTSRERGTKGGGGLHVEFFVEVGSVLGFRYLTCKLALCAPPAQGRLHMR